MSRGQVTARLQEIRSRLLQAGYIDPHGLSTKAVDMVTFALRDCGRSLTADELLQAAGMFSLAAEKQLEKEKDPQPAGEARSAGPVEREKTMSPKSTIETDG
jgi:hypothetical protein